MPLSIEQLVQSLTDSGLVPVEDIQGLLEANAAGERPKDAARLAERLVEKKLLTAFQAERACAGEAGGLCLGNYVILDKIGEGGMGQVFKAQHRRMKRLVAVKMLPPAINRSPEAIKRFEREVEAAAKLEHANIVTAYDADECNAAHFLVMQYVDGQDLASLVKRQGPLPVAKAVNYLLQAARGLNYAHRAGVVHRDIKPSNLLLDHNGTIRILDMGLARLETTAGGGDDLTNTGQIMGTVAFMSPEQAFNTKLADHRADIYSLGCTLYFLLAGRPPFTGDSPMERMLSHREHPIPSLRSVCKDVSPALDAVFQRMLAKKPDDRYPSVLELLDALQACGLGRQPGGTPAPTSSGPRSGDPANAAAERIATAVAQRKTPGEEETKSSQMLLDTQTWSPPGIETPALRRPQEINSPQVVAEVARLPTSEFWRIPLRVVFLLWAAKRRSTRRLWVGMWAAFGLLLLIGAALALFSGKPHPQGGEIERRVAGWAATLGGKLKLSVGGQARDARTMDDLPPEAFHIVALDFAGNANIGDRELLFLRGLTGIRQLDLSGTRITDQGTAPLEELTTLTELRLTGTRLAPDAIASLQFALPRCRIVF